MDLSRFLRAMLPAYEAMLAGQGKRLITLIDPGVMAFANEDVMEPVVENLLENAASFTPPGSAIEVELAIERGNACLRVLDSGPGVSPRYLPHIFERSASFRNGKHNDADFAGGHQGLGLWIVKRNIEGLGGTVTRDEPASRRFRNHRLFALQSLIFQHVLLSHLYHTCESRIGVTVCVHRSGDFQAVLRGMGQNMTGYRENRRSPPFLRQPALLIVHHRQRAAAHHNSAFLLLMAACAACGGGLIEAAPPRRCGSPARRRNPIAWRPATRFISPSSTNPISAAITWSVLMGA